MGDEEVLVDSQQLDNYDYGLQERYGIDVKHKQMRYT